MRNTTTSQINLPCTLPLRHNCHISRDKMSSENWKKWHQEQSYAVLQPGRSFAYIPLWLTQFPWRKFPSRALSSGCLAQEPSSHNTALQIAHSIHCVPPCRTLNIPFLVTSGFCPNVSHAFFSVSSTAQTLAHMAHNQCMFAKVSVQMNEQRKKWWLCPPS